MTFKNMKSANDMKCSASSLSFSTRVTGMMSAIIITGLLAFALPDTSEAQSQPKAPQDAAPMSGPTPPAPPGAPDQVPIDGGLGLLVAAGGAYALRKMHKNKNAE